MRHYEELLAIGDRVVGWAQRRRADRGRARRRTRDRGPGLRRRDRVVHVGRVRRDRHPGGPRPRARASPTPGTLDDDVLAETLAEARDNATFATADEWVGLAGPDGVPITELNLYDASGSRTFDTEAKIAMAIELERAITAGDARIIGVESADYVDAVAHGAVVSSTGIRHGGRDSGCYLAGPTRWPPTATTPRPASATRSLVHPRTSTSPPRRAEAVDRATRLLGAHPGAVRTRRPSCSTRSSPHSSCRSSAVSSTPRRC